MNQTISILALATAALLGSCRHTPATTYTIEGAVACAGEFPPGDDMTLWEAVMLAEPVEARCDLDRVELRREKNGEPLLLTVDVNEIIETGDTTFNIKVRAGDVILVPEKSGE